MRMHTCAHGYRRIHYTHTQNTDSLTRKNTGSHFELRHGPYLLPNIHTHSDKHVHTHIHNTYTYDHTHVSHILLAHSHLPALY
jgi:hypothetical protein